MCKDRGVNVQEGKNTFPFRISYKVPPSVLGREARVYNGKDTVSGKVCLGLSSEEVTRPRDTPTPVTTQGSGSYFGLRTIYKSFTTHVLFRCL